MPSKEFLESYPLYRKFKVDRLPSQMNSFPKVQINMGCPTCKSNQTFVMTNDLYENCQYSNYPSAGVAFRMVYMCTHCQKFERLFFVKIDEDKKWIMKIGQFPAWEIIGEPNIERLLCEHSSYYNKGLVCESQGYGIGAYGYYRRIVEKTIDLLLSEVSELLTGNDLEIYKVALAKTKETIVTQEKIEIVKDLLPPILRPDGMNPLSVLHSTLSAGLHAESDEICLEYAQACREILVFLVNQIAASKSSSRDFTKSMRKLLDKKLQRGS